MAALVEVAGVKSVVVVVACGELRIVVTGTRAVVGGAKDLLLAVVVAVVVEVTAGTVNNSA